MRYALSIVTLIVVVASAYFFVLDARSKHIVDQYRPAPPKKAKKATHATLVPVAGQKSAFKVSLTDKAAQRIGLKSEPIREERTTRTRILTGIVEAATDSSLHVAVPLSGRTDEPAPGTPVPLRKVGGSAVVATGHLVQIAAGGDDAAQRVARFRLEGASAPLAAGERLQAEIALGATGLRKLIASSAVVYDAKGGTWVYVAVEPLVFVRAPVTVDYVAGGIAHLTAGPPAGTAVAVGGVVEISGTESRIGSVSISASF